MGKKSRRVRLGGPAKDAANSSPPDTGATSKGSAQSNDAADTGAASTTSKLCAVCGKPGVSSCSACRREFYCGPTCQRSHWSEHKRECTGRCKLRYAGTVADGHGDAKRETEYEFKEAIQSKTLARDWTDPQKGSPMIQNLIDKYAGAKFALRDDWRCVCCSGPAVRIVSRVDLTIAFHAPDGGAALGGIELMALVDQAACNKPECGAWVKVLCDMAAQELKEDVPRL